VEFFLKPQGAESREEGRRWEEGARYKKTPCSKLHAFYLHSLYL
jgi:hypothetical protein